jgi:hypothetical protein
VIGENSEKHPLFFVFAAYDSTGVRYQQEVFRSPLFAYAARRIKFTISPAPQTGLKIIGFG